MNLYTTVEMPVLPELSHDATLLMMGSCFTTEIGSKLTKTKFKVDVNPYGVLYNPSSIATALKEMLQNKHYMPEELFRHQDYWHSLMHHSDFSAPAIEETLQRINRRIEVAHEELKDLNILMLTWGSAWVYEEKTGGKVVGNCHKLPEKQFRRRKLTVEEIVDDYTSLLTGMFARIPALKVLLTVSPIRHLRDGLHENQLSKATLLLAVNRLQEIFQGRLFYFPAYEILLDELRDYRFYADDMVHPSAQAVEIVWERLVEKCMSSETQILMKRLQELERALAHRPLHPENEEYKRFLQQIMLKIEEIQKKYPYLDLEKEKELCRTRLNK